MKIIILALAIMLCAGIGHARCFEYVELVLDGFGCQWQITSSRAKEVTNSTCYYNVPNDEFEVCGETSSGKVLCGHGRPTGVCIKRKP
jgi:hypothetical protein